MKELPLSAFTIPKKAGDVNIECEKYFRQRGAMEAGKKYQLNRLSFPGLMLTSPDGYDKIGAE